jgi:hypothetical protein
MKRYLAATVAAFALTGIGVALSGVVGIYG